VNAYTAGKSDDPHEQGTFHDEKGMVYVAHIRAIEVRAGMKRARMHNVEL